MDSKISPIENSRQINYRQRTIPSYLIQNEPNERITYITDPDSPLIKIVEKLEKEYFNGNVSNAPAENEEGLRDILKIGGQIILQSINGQYDGCIETIRIDYLKSHVDKLSFSDSTLSLLIRNKALNVFEGNEILVYGWLGKTWRCMRLANELIQLRNTYNKKVVGFVSCSNLEAQKRYDRIGRKTIYVDRVYFDDDSHWAYELL